MAARAVTSIRAERSVRMFLKGAPAAEIAASLGISRKTVYAYLKAAGVDVLDASVRARLGCSYAEATALNEGLPLWKRPSLARAYCVQQVNANHRGVGWEITFPQWIKVWRDSGHLAERRRGNGYVMARHGDTGPYHVNNVYIALSVQNIRDGAAFRRARKQAKAA
jgi:hypothetical protein